MAATASSTPSRKLKVASATQVRMAAAATSPQTPSHCGGVMISTESAAAARQSSPRRNRSNLVPSLLMPSPIPGMLAPDKWKSRYDFQLAFRKRLTMLSVASAWVFSDTAYVLRPMVNETLSGAPAARRKTGKYLDFTPECTVPRPAGVNPNGDGRI